MWESEIHYLLKQYSCSSAIHTHVYRLLTMELFFDKKKKHYGIIPTKFVYGPFKVYVIRRLGYEYIIYNIIIIIARSLNITWS